MFCWFYVVSCGFNLFSNFWVFLVVEKVNCKLVQSLGIWVLSSLFQVVCFWVSFQVGVFIAGFTFGFLFFRFWGVRFFLEFGLVSGFCFGLRLFFYYLDFGWYLQKRGRGFYGELWFSVSVLIRFIFFLVRVGWRCCVLGLALQMYLLVF